MIVVFTSPREGLVRTFDHRNVVAAEPIELAAPLGNRYRVPIGAPSDLASTPSVLWGPPANLPPFGTYARSARVHDAAYQGTLEVWQGDQWVPARLTKDQCDELLLACMVADGVNEEERRRFTKGSSLAAGRRSGRIGRPPRQILRDYSPLTSSASQPRQSCR